jgi:uncharacterized protein (DUF1800 family)
MAAIGEDGARHLLARTTLGPLRGEIDALKGLDRDRAVASILSFAKQRRSPHEPPPSLTPRDLADDKDARKLLIKNGAVALKSWWFAELAHQGSGLHERMILFWHNHFTSSLRAIRAPHLILQQHLTLRAHALGSFRELLKHMVCDPALLIYLNNNNNKRQSPNENFARELFELFTLGEGNYSERDVKEAARALTGWGVKRPDLSFHIHTKQHDIGPKTILGDTAGHDGDSLVELILKQPACARWIALKLWRELMAHGEEPTSKQLDQLAATFRRDYDISALVHAILTHPTFWQPKQRAGQIKSPVCLLAGTIRVLNVRVDAYETLARACERLGQDLFDPPNVKGWPGGNAWITSETLLRRQQQLSLLLRAEELVSSLSSGGLHGLLRTAAPSPQDRTRVATLLLAAPPAMGLPEDPEPLAFVRSLITDPVYQLM